TRTELGRAHAASTWLRLKQAAERDPTIRKQWRRSGKLRSRHTHDFADGQQKEVLDWFLIGGEKMMYPRDPTASAKNTINCGCVLLPAKASWQVDNPGPRPFSSQEIAAQPSRADSNALIAERVADAMAAMQSAVRARFGGDLNQAFEGLPAAAVQALIVLEAQIVGSVVEQGVVVSLSGNALWRGSATTNEPDRFTLPPSVATGHVFTHSHTADDGFSVYDLLEFATGDAAEFRAVSHSLVVRLLRGNASLNRTDAYVWLYDWRKRNANWYASIRGQPDTAAQLNAKLASEFAEHFQIRYISARRVP
ncbi:MAG: hypothetical protein ACRCV9_04235, partial [Burkholderiaceae bacterium]